MAAISVVTHGARVCAAGWQWTRQRGTSENDEAYAVSSEAIRNVYIAGDTLGAFDGQVSEGYSEVFVMKFNASGVWQWTRQRSTSDDDLANALSSDAVAQERIAGRECGSRHANAALRSVTRLRHCLWMPLEMGTSQVYRGRMRGH